MKVGDLVKYRRDLPHERAGLGLVLENAESAKWKTVWWSVRWGCGKIEIVNERNMRVVNASR
jgi:hypothetical protein